ncbi:MFS transporter [Desulfosporosinus sp. SYSU MS00001]|uniref:MFS transporter n=1 Tax=Desulfosporosinus sp. SYSU MS00001 TaxID=3416284 RepID=UPI003CFA8250
MSTNASLHHRKGYYWFVVGTVCIGAFMAALDASIINVAMPTLSKSFAVSMNSVEWVSIAYLLALTSLLTLLGSLSDRIGRKKFYTVGFVIFGFGSGLCGVVSTMPLLIGSRVLQALGAAMLQANSIAIITSVVPSTSRGKAIGIQGAAQAIGLSIGPTVGGLIIGSFGWRLIFYINIPIAIIGTITASFILPKDQPNLHSSRFDYLGALLFTPFLILLVLIFKNGYKVGWLSPEILVESLVSIIFFSLFILREKKCKNPMIDFHLFKNRTFTSGNITGLLSYSLMFGVLFLMPFYLEWILQLSPFLVGLIMTVVSLAMFIMSPFSGALADHMGTKLLTSSGMIISSLGAIVLILLSNNTAAYVYLLGLVLVGAGIGIFTPPNNSSVMGSIPPEHAGVAGGILNMSRSLGMSMGVAIAGTLYDGAFSDYSLVHHTLAKAQILSFHVGFAGITILGIIASLICVFAAKHSDNTSVELNKYISLH